MTREQRAIDKALTAFYFNFNTWVMKAITDINKSGINEMMKEGAVMSLETSADVFKEEYKKACNAKI